jgi:hypothetical protein
LKPKGPANKTYEGFLANGTVATHLWCPFRVKRISTPATPASFTAFVNVFEHKSSRPLRTKQAIIRNDRSTLHLDHHRHKTFVDSTSDNHHLNVSSALAQQFDHASRNMDTIERNGKLDPVPDISPDGDVVLVVGSRNVRLRIQSQCLRCASKVFGAMFGPHWSEGQGFSKESPREVPLVEDDADALRTICCVLHHRNDDVPQSLTPKEVLQIAIEADKYGLNITLKYARVQ